MISWPHTTPAISSSLPLPPLLPKDLIVPKRYCRFSNLCKQLRIVVSASGQRTTSKGPPQLALPIDRTATAKGSKEAKIGCDGRLREGQQGQLLGRAR